MLSIAINSLITVSLVMGGMLFFFFLNEKERKQVNPIKYQNESMTSVSLQVISAILDTDCQIWILDFVPTCPINI